MKIIYVAGPFRAPTQWGIAGNIRRAEQVGFAVMQAGAMPLIPHANTQHFHGAAPDEFFIEGTLELMRRCDGVVMVPGWWTSAGAEGERAEAERLGLPLYDHVYGQGGADAVYVKRLRTWLRTWQHLETRL